MQTYSTYEAKARFSEVIRKVRMGQRIVIAYRGEDIAEIVPIDSSRPAIEQVLERLEDEGVVSRARKPASKMKPVAKRPGALKRFLESRE